MAELTPVTEIKYEQFKNLYDPSKSYENQNVSLTGKFDKETFDTFSNIAEQEKELGFLEKLTGGLEKLFSASAAEPDIFTGGITSAPQSYDFKSMADIYEDSLKDSFDYSGLSEPTNYGQAPFEGLKRNYGQAPFEGLQKTGIMENAPQIVRDTISPSLLYDDTTPVIDTSFGVANEPDVKEEEKKLNKGLPGVFRLILGALIPGAGLLMGGGSSGLKGLKSLNQRIQNSDFAQAENLADYLDMRSYGGLRERENRAAQTMAQARGLQKRIDRGEFDSTPSTREQGGERNREGAFSRDRGVGQDAGTSGGTGGRRGGAGRFR